MRKFTFTFLLISIVIFNSCGPTVEQAIKYNDKIIEQDDSISAKIEALIDTYDKFDPKEMDQAYNEAMKEIQKGIDFATKLKPFADDASFKDGALVLFNAYKSILEVQHKRIIELLKLPESEYGDKEVEEFEQLIEQANKKIDVELDNLIAIQEKFANTHQFPIEEDK